MAEDYARAKNKEISKSTHEKEGKLQNKIAIGNSLTDSRILSQGDFGTVELQSKTRLEAASAIGRIQTYSDEKRQQL